MNKQLVCVGLAVLLLLPLAFTACKKGDQRESPTSSSTASSQTVKMQEAKKPELSPQIKTRKPFVDAIEPALYELPSQALATWREMASNRPVLVLFSTHPLLSPIPPDREKTLAKLLQQGPREELIRRARMLTPNPAVLPPEAVSAAIASNLISEVVVVLPTTGKPEEVSLDSFREKALNAGFITKDEANALRLNNGTISGSVRGIPLLIPHPDKLPKIDRPVLLHIDLGYFKDAYVNEVKTPVYDLIYKLATSLKTAGYPTLAATLSFSNQEVGFSLESRFIIRDLSTILRKPQLLDGNTPASWTLRAQALYANAMFSETKARELTAQAVKTTPDDAAAHFALAIDLFEQNRPEEGFAALDQAVAIDRGYGLEYLALSERGREIGKIEKSIELLQKAEQALPDNPFIRRELAHQLIQAGRVKEARPLIAALEKLDWSESFYPEVPPLLEKMAEAASVDVIVPKNPPVSESAPAGMPAVGMPGFNHMGMGRSRH